MRWKWIWESSMTLQGNCFLSSGKWKEQCNVKLSIYQKWYSHLFFNMLLFAWRLALFPWRLAQRLHHSCTWNVILTLFFISQCVGHYSEIDFVKHSRSNAIMMKFFTCLFSRVMTFLPDGHDSHFRVMTLSL